MILYAKITVLVPYTKEIGERGLCATVKVVPTDISAQISSKNQQRNEQRLLLRRRQN